MNFHCLVKLEKVGTMKMIWAVDIYDLLRFVLLKSKRCCKKDDSRSEKVNYSHLSSFGSEKWSTRYSAMKNQVVYLKTYI